MRLTEMRRRRRRYGWKPRATRKGPPTASEVRWFKTDYRIWKQMKGDFGLKSRKGKGQKEENERR